MTGMLSTKNLVVGYGTTRIVEDVGLEIHSGEVHGLIGPNGTGKSTLLRTLGGLLRPLEGSLWLGRPPRVLHDIRHRERAKALAFLPQDIDFDVDLTVRSVVELGRFAHRFRFDRLRGSVSNEERRIVDDALNRVGVAHLAHRSVATLSGGQRQLTFIAKLLAQQAQVLLLDEPISALDLGYQLEILELLRALAAEGHTIVVVLHDLNLAARMCDRLTMLNRGSVRASGEPATVLNQELLDELYGIRSIVDVDPLTNSPRVTALARH